MPKKNNTPSYRPPFTVNPAVLRLAAEIGEAVGRLSANPNHAVDLRLRRVNRIRTIQGSLAIEGNTLTTEQITAILDGKRVLAPPREIREARNAIAAYDRLDKWNPHREADLLAAHRTLMEGLVEAPGAYRRSGVGVVAGNKVIHLAPPAKQVPALMGRLLEWLRSSEHHPLIAGSVFHYEFEFIHPFADGNGRMGRLWQTLILCRWNPVFARIPVESLVHEHRSDYYQALRDSTKQGESSPFIAFMLAMIRDAVAAVATPQDAPQVTPQVASLLRVLAPGRSLSRDELQRALGLRDRKSFRERYLAPALAANLVEMTLPDKPNSRAQRYRRTALGERCIIAAKRKSKGE